MEQQQKNEIGAKLNQERNQEISEALEILGAGEKETLKDVATRRMWQAMPELMSQREGKMMTHGERHEEHVAQLKQITDDGPLQDSQNALLKIGTECVFTFGQDERGRQEVYLAKVTRVTPEGRPLLMVFEDYEGRFRPSLRQDAYFSSAKPGTPLAARCWGWPEGGVRQGQ